MTEIIRKPRFEFIDLPDFRLKFNTQIVGPMKFNNLRNAYYGKGFRMSTFPELIQLIYVSSENQESEPAEEVLLHTMEERNMIGNTAVLYALDGMYVQDNPNIINGKISMNQKTLQNKLGSYEEKGVVFSDDRSVRFTPHNFEAGFYIPPPKLAENTGIIAIAGGRGNAEMLAKASKQLRLATLLHAVDYTVNFNAIGPVGSFLYTLVGPINMNHIYLGYPPSSDRLNSLGVRELEK